LLAEGALIIDNQDAHCSDQIITTFLHFAPELLNRRLSGNRWWKIYAGLY